MEARRLGVQKFASALIHIVQIFLLYHFHWLYRLRGERNCALLSKLYVSYLKLYSQTDFDDRPYQVLQWGLSPNILLVADSLL